MVRPLSARLVALALPVLASCSFLLDFDELREGGPRPQAGTAGAAGDGGKGGAAGSGGKAGGEGGRGGSSGSAGATEAGAAGEGGEGGASVPSRVDFGRVPFQPEPVVTPLGEPMLVGSLPAAAPDFRGPDWPAMAFVPPNHLTLSFIEPAETGDDLPVQRYRVCYPD
jgi:hypothetical protein